MVPGRPLLEQRLRQGLQRLQLEVTDHQVGLLLTYAGLLERWNRAYNLTAVTEAADIVDRHLLDCLAVAPYLRGQYFIDVGTGPGLPGIALAIALPGKFFVLLDSNGKKTRFLFQARLALGLSNIQEVQARVESYRPERNFDGVISRAFASLATMVDSCHHLLADSGRFYAMKGRYPKQELSQLVKPYNVCTSHRLQIPGLDEDRHLIEIGKTP